eukprot:526437_1
MTDTTTKLTLVYFPIAGRAEAIRLTAAVGDVAFTNKVVSGAGFMELRSNGSLPFGQVPILEVENTDAEGAVSTSTISQSNAILRYMGKKAGIYPSNDLEALKVDEYNCIFDDLVNPLVMTYMGAKKSLVSDNDWTHDEILEIRRKWREQVLPKYLGKVEADLKASESGWLVGDSITIADVNAFTWFEWLQSGVLDGVPKTVLDEYPACIAMMDKVKSNDAIHKWYEKYSKPYGSFDYE